MRNGKIATLPSDIRNLLSFRMHEGQPNTSLLAWLNALPQVQERIRSHGKGETITKQNLSQWRLGGFREWSIHYDLERQATRLTEYSDELHQSVDASLLAGRMADLLAARYAALLNSWDGSPNPEFEDKLRLLRGLNRDLALLQKTQERSARQKVEDARQSEDDQKQELDKWKDKMLKPLMAKLDQSSLQGLYEVTMDKATAKRMAEFVINVRYNLRKKLGPVASRPTPSKPVKPRLPRRSHAKAGPTATADQSDQSTPSDPSDPSDPTDSEPIGNPQSEIRNPQCPVQSNPVKPSQSESLGLPDPPDAIEAIASPDQPGTADDSLHDPGSSNPHQNDK
jgi:hypothetical protein